MLDISLGDGGTVCCPLEPANAFPAAPSEHIPATPCASRVSRSQLHLTCTHSAVGLVSSHASFPICASFLPHDLPTIVCLVPAQQQWPNFSRSCQFFPPPAARLSLASSFACGGPRRAIIGQLFLGGVFLLLDSSRPARRTAKAWRLRPARGTAPRVSGSRQSVLHERQGNAAAAVTTAAAAAAGRRVQHIA
jgi:hypothetical protein